PAEEPAAEEAPAEESDADDADAEYLSLASVEGFIRQRIASEAIDADLNDLNADLAQYYRATIKSDDGNVGEKDVDMAAFAEAHGFQYHMTHVLTDFNAEQPDAFSFEQALIADLLPVNTLQEIYSSAPMPYSPQRAVNGSTMYVFRAIEVIPQTRPEFEDCKDFVVEQWKLRQAVKIAQKNADELLAKIQGGEDFDQAAEAAQATVVETEKFTWMRSSLGPYNPMPQLSEVCEAGVEPGQANRDNKEIVAPGWAFFELAYSLGQDGVGQCLNQAEDRVFVVKVVDNGDDELISEVFEKLDSESSARFAAMQIQRYEFERYHEDLVKSLRDSSGFQWIWLPHVDAER
ncbi:MAG: hypothetical protein Q4G03_12025, partial [Planctomycetia bacterium]|nr:hypothetical protein [Planctomycetia bacterium]